MIISVDDLTGFIPAGTNTLYIGYSGGVDSHVLLHLFANTELKSQLVAVYIHHGLQAQADDWERHCARQCQVLDVPFLAIRVAARAVDGQSPEEAARLARYAAFKPLIKANDVLLLAQHDEDQAETFLLQALRGGGLAGLSGMPVQADFGLGKLIRPLLNVSKQQIVAYGHHFELAWIEDPSNQDDQFDRNFLRNQVIPLLRQRWPALNKTLSRSASHCAEGLRIVDQQAADWLAKVTMDDSSLLISALRQLRNYHEQCWVIKRWLLNQGLRSPSQAVISNILDQSIYSSPDANPVILLQDHVLRRYHDRLYCLNKQFGLPQKISPRIWHPGDLVFPLHPGLELQARVASSGILRRLWLSSVITVRPRIGGEQMRLPYRFGAHSLKKLYQESLIPPWERDLRPLIFLNDQLVAVAGLWIDQSVWGEGEECVQIEWRKLSEK